MKKSLLLIATAILTLTGFSQTPPDYVSTDGLVAWWPFNGNADDESANSNNGTVNGATLNTDRDGNANAAYSFDGVNQDKIIVPHNSELSFPDATLSISIWVKLDGTNYDSMSIITKGGEYGCGRTDNTGNRINFHQYGVACQMYNINNIEATNDIWVHYVYVSDESEAILYENGQVRQTGPRFSGCEPVISSGDLVFGVVDPNYPLQGLIDDIGIWSRMLTECEVQDLYEAKVSSCTGVGLEENKQNQFSVYPNPVKESLTLELNQLSNTGFTITDQLGKVVREGNISSQKQDIDVSSLPKGVYVISVGEVNQKFIKE